MKSMKITAKLLAGFGIVTLLVVVVGVVGLSSVTRQGAVITDFGENILPNTRTLMQVELGMTRVDGSENLLLSRDLDERARVNEIATFSRNKQLIDAAVRVYESRKFISDEDRALWGRFKPLLDAWWETHKEFERLALAWQLDPQNDPLFSRLTTQGSEVTRRALEDALGVLHEDLGLYRSGSDVRVRRSAALSRQAIFFTLLGLAAGVIIAILLGLTTALGITRPLQTGVRFARRIAEGDLTARIDVGRRGDEIGQLAGTLNEMADKFRKSFEALKTSEERFRVLVEHAPEAILVFDVDRHRIIDANSNAQRLFGYGLAELRDVSAWGLFSLEQPDGRPTAESLPDHISRTLEGTTEVFERRMRTRQGQELCCEVRLVKLPSVDRRLIRASYIDITERKRIEETIRTLSHAIEQSPAIVIITDTAWNIEYVNPKFTQVTGYSPDEVIGKKPEILKSGLTSEVEYQKLSLAIASGREWHGEFVNRKKNGDLFRERASISPIVDAAGVISHFVAVKEDITEYRSMEEKLRQTQKMDSIGRLAGGVAHDFNNILAVILGNLGLLKESMQTGAEMADTLHEIETAANRAAGLTRQLLLFSRKQVIDTRPVDLNEIVNNVTRMLRRLIGEDIDLVFQGEPTSLRINADAGMIEQVLMNLCVNARDAMPDGGQLIIATRRVELADEPNLMNPEALAGSFILLSVTDTGCGMDADTQRHIFEPFFTTKEVGKGTGFGLANVYGIIRQHNGWIQVTSAPGEGATFQVYLPAHSEAQEFQNSSEAAQPLGGSETVLMVEDDPALRRIASLWLRKLGYNVLEAPDGVEALKLWEQCREQVELLLTDMVMPGGISGSELAERLTRDKKTLKAIVNSGFDPEKSRAEFLAARGIAFLPKPYSASELAKAVRARLDEP